MGDTMIVIPKHKKTVAAIGKFDGFHLGHTKLVRTAVQTAKESDSLSLIFFIGAPSESIMTRDECDRRAKEFGVDVVFHQPLSEDFRSMSAEEFVCSVLRDKLKCSTVVVGYDFRFAKGRSADAHELERLCALWGINCIIIDEVALKDSDGVSHTVSSSYIRYLVQLGRVDEASRYLGRVFSVSGRVVTGRRIGTAMGIPTANLKPEENIVLPPDGVYATHTIIDDKKYLSITNIGTNPTVSDNNGVTIETNILDFSGDVYDENITLEFAERIRGEMKFDSLDALTRQIKNDIEYVRNKYSKTEQRF